MSATDDEFGPDAPEQRPAPEVGELQLRKALSTMNDLEPPTGRPLRPARHHPRAGPHLTTPLHGARRRCRARRGRRGRHDLDGQQRQHRRAPRAAARPPRRRRTRTPTADPAATHSPSAAPTAPSGRRGPGRGLGPRRVDLVRRPRDAPDGRLRHGRADAGLPLAGRVLRGVCRRRHRFAHRRRRDPARPCARGPRHRGDAVTRGRRVRRREALLRGEGPRAPGDQRPASSLARQGSRGHRRHAGRTRRHRRGARRRGRLSRTGRPAATATSSGSCRRRRAPRASCPTGAPCRPWSSSRGSASRHTVRLLGMEQPTPPQAPISPLDALRRICFLLERGRESSYRIDAFRKTIEAITLISEDELARTRRSRNPQADQGNRRLERRDHRPGRARRAARLPRLRRGEARRAADHRRRRAVCRPAR